MSLEISIFDSRNIPKFVFRTKAEPSNVESCTPKPSRARVNSFATATATTAETTTGAALGQPTQLFPSSAVKAPMHREHSDSSLLSQGLSNHCISDDSVAAATATAARRYETSPVGNQRQQQSQRALNHSRSPRGDLHPHPPHHSHQHNQSSRPVNVNDFRSSPLGGPGSPASSSHAHTRMSTISALPPPVYVNAYRGVPPPQDIPYTAGNGVSNGALPLYLPVGAASHLQENQVPHRLPISNQHAVRDGALSGYGNNDEYRPHDHTMNGKQRSHSLSSDPRRAGRLADNGALPLQYVAYGTAPPPGMISFSSSAPAPVSAPVHSSNHAAFVYQQQQQQHGASDVIPPVLLSDHSPVPMSAVHAPPPPPGSAVPSPQGGYRTGQAAGSPRPLPFPHIQQDYYRASPNFQQSVLDGPRHQQHSDLFPPPLSVVPITTHDINSHDNSSGSYSGRSNGSSSGSLSPSKRYHKELLVPSSASSHGSADSHASSSSSSDNRRKK